MGKHSREVSPSDGKLQAWTLLCVATMSQTRAVWECSLRGTGGEAAWGRWQRAVAAGGMCVMQLCSCGYPPVACAGASPSAWAVPSSPPSSPSTLHS